MFEIYKTGQGKYARLLAASNLSLLNIFGCYSLFNYLNAGSLARISITEIPGLDMSLNLPLMLSVGLFLIISYAIFKLVNIRKTADFLIETETEMRRVTWPSQSELIGSSIVVIMTVILLGLFIFIIDYGVHNFFKLFYPKPTG